MEYLGWSAQVGIELFGSTPLKLESRLFMFQRLPGSMALSVRNSAGGANQLFDRELVHCRSASVQSCTFSACASYGNASKGHLAEKSNHSKGL